MTIKHHFPKAGLFLGITGGRSRASNYKQFVLSQTLVDVVPFLILEKSILDCLKIL